jgi:hypothetical protein
MWPDEGDKECLQNFCGKLDGKRPLGKLTNEKKTSALATQGDIVRMEI